MSKADLVKYDDEIITREEFKERFCKALHEQAKTELYEAQEDLATLREQNKALLVALEAVEFVMAAVDEYVGYQHNGDPYEEDARTMGEMSLNSLHENGKLAEIKAKLTDAVKLVRGEEGGDDV